MKLDQGKQPQIIKSVLWIYAALEVFLFCSGNLLVGLAGLFCVLLIVVFCGLLQDKMKPLEIISQLADEDDFYQTLEATIEDIRRTASVAGEDAFAEAFAERCVKPRMSENTTEEIAAAVETEILAAYPHLRKALVRNCLPANLRRIYHRVTK